MNKLNLLDDEVACCFALDEESENANPNKVFKETIMK